MTSATNEEFNFLKLFLIKSLRFETHSKEFTDILVNKTLNKIEFQDYLINSNDS